jgi:hypothetical protein
MSGASWTSGQSREAQRSRRAPLAVTVTPTATTTSSARAGGRRTATAEGLGGEARVVGTVSDRAGLRTRRSDAEGVWPGVPAMSSEAVCIEDACETVESVTTTLLKLLLAPLLILLATLAGRRWGPAMGGWLAGLPLTSGPVSLILALEHGPEFAGRAALGTLFGLISLAAFCLAYAIAARKLSWSASLGAALAAFGISTLAFEGVKLPLGLAFALVCAVLAAVGAVMAGGGPPRPARRLVAGDLAVRMALAALLVLVLTAVAGALGPALAGSLSPIPIFGALLAVFAHRDQGGAAAAQLLRGMVLGSFGFAAFLLTVGGLLDRLAIAPTYALASAGALGIHGVTLALIRRVA